MNIKYLKIMKKVMLFFQGKVSDSYHKKPTDELVKIIHHLENTIYWTDRAIQKSKDH